MSDHDVEPGVLVKRITLPILGPTSAVTLVSFTLVLEDIAVPVLGTSLFVELQETSL